MGGDVQLALDLVVAEQAHAVALAADHAGGDQGGRVDRLLGVQLARLDGLGDAGGVRHDHQYPRAAEDALRDALDDLQAAEAAGHADLDLARVAREGLLDAPDRLGLVRCEVRHARRPLGQGPRKPTL